MIELLESDDASCPDLIAREPDSSDDEDEKSSDDNCSSDENDDDDTSMPGLIMREDK